MLWTSILCLLVILLCSYLIVFQTSISISLLRREMFRPFSQNLTLPSGVTANLSNPLLYNLANTTVVKIPCGEGYLAGWYLSAATCPVTVLYLHGRSQNRGWGHRVGIYRVLQNMGYCVLAVDYRGFGDSSPIEIHEGTVVEDAVIAHAYLKKVYKPQKILIWGHSLGAPVAAHCAAEHSDDDDGVQRYLVLESAFDNMQHLVEEGGLPEWQQMGIMMVGLQAADLAFRSDEYLPRVSVPVLMLHTEDDPKVGVQLARTLYQVAREAGKKDLAMVVMGKELGLLHTGIYQYESLPQLLRRFLSGKLRSGEILCRLPEVESCKIIDY